MSTITLLTGSDGITTANSMTKINANATNLNNDKLETSVLSTDSTFASASDAKIASQLATKLYVDVGGNVNASETSKGIVEEATDAEVTAGTATGATGAKLFVTPAKLATRMLSILKFGGTGADGALVITSGATNIDLGGAAVVTKNYTSISITGTGSLTFSNPHANGTIIMLKSQGNMTITSSTVPAINAIGMGASKNNHGLGFNYALPGTDSSNGNGGGGGGGGGYGGGSGANGGGSNFGVGGVGGGGNGISTLTYLYSKGVMLGTGAGGGNGHTGGFTGGDGGGGGGSIVILYNSLTANSTTLSVAGGAGGSATASPAGVNSNGGGGLYIECAGAFNGTSTISADGNQGLAASVTRVSAGGAGGAGYSLVAINTEFA